ncbi:MAG TPA: HD domain-containing phosphohydrolase [Trueperaceae bacterium]
MLRRFFAGNETAGPDPVSAAERLASVKGQRERCEVALKYLRATLAGDVRGYVVLGNDDQGYRFAAAEGYPAGLLGLTPEHGPWREPGPRITHNLIKELFTPNSKELRHQFGELGLREANAALTVPVAGNCGALGALILCRHSSEPFHEDDLRRAAQWGHLLGEVLGLSQDLNRSRRSLVEFTNAFIEAMEAQDFTQLGHAQRVTSYALSIGRALELGRTRLADLYFAAMLHDVGKLGIGTDLSIEDDTHMLRGANLVASSPLLQEAAEGIRSHHENWDGSGLPAGLQGEAIPLLGRIIAVADTFDLLSSDRGQALPMREVEKGLEARAGRELDPKLVPLFVNILRQGKSTADLGRLRESDLPF